ncbi:MAG TPA: leucyl aminopeptidase [Vicinamibacterales bacterium]|nr:leucyl aminopeptidase [Vicinamibacterales bacterium]
MQPAYEIPRFTSSRTPVADLDADLIAVAVPTDQLASFDWLDRATDGQFNAAVTRTAFSGKACEQWGGQTLAGTWRTSQLLAVGAGPATEMSPERARRIGGCVGLTARHQRRQRVAIVIPEGWPTAAVEALTEGITLANYDNGQYKSKHEGRFFVTAVEIVGGAAQVKSAVDNGARVGEAINAARVLINEPGNRLTPRDFVARGQELLDLPDVTTEILDEKRMAELGMGLLLGVAAGSAEPPRMLVARYEPKGAPASPVLGLIGKGITFDTGGISIKPADGMERMKDDMAGGATVISALRAIAFERLSVRVIVIVPSTENMPGGRATKPGDIHRGASGITVEINNTDAEGRLILGDGLWYAKELGATHLIDVATLTGACVVALGKITTGLFGSDGWVEVVRDAAERGGERVWPMPLFEDYKESLKSEMADMLNSPGRAGGAITAAMFLKEFVGTTPWAHLDIAGTAWADEPRAWTMKGATGVMIRTLVEVARSAGKNWP